MGEVERLTEELANAIKESDEYRNYLRTYHEISQYPSLMRATNELRRRNFELQNSYGAEGMFDRVEAFRKQYAELRAEETVNEFLRAELCFARMIQRISKSLIRDIDFDMKFMNDN